MGQGSVSGRSGAPGDVEHRSSVATHPKRFLDPPQAGLSGPVESLRVLPDVPASRGDARLATGPLSPVKLAPIHQDML